MTPDPPRLTLAALVAIAALGLASFLRLRQLDWPPLSDTEAVFALQAADETPEASAFWPPEARATEPTSAAYATLSRPLFVGLGANDATARLAPALVGVALVAFVMLGRGGRKPEALAAALLLAVSPTLVAASRQAGGLSIALLGLGSLFLFFRHDGLRKEQVGLGLGIGILAGFGLSAGSAAFSGILGFGLGIGIFYFILRTRLDESSPDLQFLRGEWRIASGALAGLLLGGTGFGFYLSELASLTNPLGEWVQMNLDGQGWPFASGVLALIAYEPLVLGLGMFGLLFAWQQRDRTGLYMGAWALGAILVHFLSPARGQDTLTWAVLPMTLLGGKMLVRILERWLEPEGFWTTAGLTAAIISLAAFIQVQLSTYARGFGFGAPSLDPGLSLAAAIAAIGLAIVALVLFGLGWSWRVAGNAAIGGAAAVLILATFSSGWRLNFGLEAATAVELWRPRASTSGVRLLQATLRAVSQAQTGRTDAIAVDPISPLPPALAWALRDYPWAGAIRPDSNALDSPVFLAAGGGISPDLRREYIGQTIVVAEGWGWGGGVPPDLLAWLVARSAPTLPEPWLVLVDSSLAGFETTELDSIGP